MYSFIHLLIFLYRTKILNGIDVAAKCTTIKIITLELIKLIKVLIFDKIFQTYQCLILLICIMTQIIKILAIILDMRVFTILLHLSISYNIRMMLYFSRIVFLTHTVSWWSICFLDRLGWIRLSQTITSWNEGRRRMIALKRRIRSSNNS